jgi:hypothetical protein
LSWDYDTQSSLYGSQKALETIHAQLNLDDQSVDLINLGAARSFSVRVRVVSLEGKPLSDRKFPIQAAADARTPVTKLALDTLAVPGRSVLLRPDRTGLVVDA